MVSCKRSLKETVLYYFLRLCSINGPQAAFTAYLAEFHSAKFRTRIIVGRGIVVHSAKFVLPLLAWAVFPLDLHYLLFGGRIGKARQWNPKIGLNNNMFRSFAFVEHLPLSVRYSRFARRSSLRIHAGISEVFDDERREWKSDGRALCGVFPKHREIERFLSSKSQTANASKLQAIISDKESPGRKR